jgi:HSP20 family protein
MTMNDRTEMDERSSETGAAVATQQAGSNAGVRRATPTPTPAVDIFEDSQGVTLLADLPGVSREKPDIRVQDHHLYIEAEAVVPTPSGLRLQHAEIQDPHFARAFTLSGDFDTARIDAQLRDGILKLSIPRRDEARRYGTSKSGSQMLVPRVMTASIPGHWHGRHIGGRLSQTHGLVSGMVHFAGLRRHVSPRTRVTGLVA